jgi:hypothetical protein
MGRRIWLTGEKKQKSFLLRQLKCFENFGAVQISIIIVFVLSISFFLNAYYCPFYLKISSIVWKVIDKMSSNRRLAVSVPTRAEARIVNETANV